MWAALLLFQDGGAGEGALTDAACLFGRSPQLVLSVGAAQPKQTAPHRVR